MALRESLRFNVSPILCLMKEDPGILTRVMCLIAQIV
jgi:hypothetical protein